MYQVTYGRLNIQPQISDLNIESSYPLSLSRRVFVLSKWPVAFFMLLVSEPCRAPRVHTGARHRSIEEEQSAREINYGRQFI
jgi:hypothetical protein